MLNDYFLATNPYTTKNAEPDKYYLDQLEKHKNCTEMTKTTDNSFEDPEKQHYKLLALLVAVFCIHFYVVSLIAQQCFTFFLTTFLVNNAMALQCQHYMYHLIHFLLAHFFTFASKLLYNRVSQLTNRLFTKVYRVAKRNNLRLSKLTLRNLCHLIKKRKIRELVCKVEKTEDEQALLSNYRNKIHNRRKHRSISKKNFFEHLQVDAYEKLKSMKNVYQNLTHAHFNITSYHYSNMETVNWSLRNFQILTVNEVNYVEVFGTEIQETEPPFASPEPSRGLTTSDDVVHKTRASKNERNHSKNPFRKIFDNRSKRIKSKNMSAGAFKNNIAKHFKNKHVFFNEIKNRGVNFQTTIVTKFSRKLREGEEFLNKEKRKFKWKKRHKEYVVFKIVSQKRIGDENELTFVAEITNAVKDKPLKLDCECYKYDFTFEDVQDVEEKADWFMRRYERSIGKPVEKSIARKDILKSLKRQAVGVIGIFSPTPFGYREKIESSVEPLELDWGQSPKAVLCGCPVTECICDGNTRTKGTILPDVGFDFNLPRMIVIQVLHEFLGPFLDPCLRKITPAPASTLMPRLGTAVSARKVFYLEKRSDNLPAEMCVSKCKDFYFKREKDSDSVDDIAAASIHDRAGERTLDKYSDEMYQDHRNEINKLASGTRASGTGLADGKVSSGKIPSGKIPSGKIPSGKIPSGKVPSGMGPGGEVPGGVDGNNIPSQGIDGDKVPSALVAGDGTAGDSPMIGDGLGKQETEGAGETPLYSKDDNIYARGFILTTATQTEFDENGKLLREETDRVKIAFKLRYTTKKDLEGTQINIEMCPCAPEHPPCELTIGSIKQQICNMKKGIEGTLKTLSSTVSSYTKSWKLGVEEMSEHISSYAKGLQSKVGFGHGEGYELIDKGTITHQPSEEGAIEPKNNGDHIEKDKQLTKGHSWPSIAPRIRYEVKNPTDNLSILAKSEDEVLNKLQNHFKNLNKAKTDICSQQSQSAECLTRTKKRHDFFDSESKGNETKLNNTVCSRGIEHPADTAKQTEAQMSKTMGQDPESLQRGEHLDEANKLLPEPVCEHSKLSDKEESPKVTSGVPATLPIETVTNDIDPAKDMTTNIEQKNSKNVDADNIRPEVEAETQNEHQDNPEMTPNIAQNDTTTAKHKFSNVSDNLKRISKHVSSKIKAVKSTTSAAKAKTLNQKQGSPEVTPDTVTNDAETAKVTSANVSDTLERIIVQKSSKTKSAKSTTSVAEASAPNEHQDSPEVKLDTVTNDAKTAKDTFVNVSASLKRFFKQKDSKTKSAKSTTSLAEVSAPNEYQGSSYVTSENYPETGKNTSANMPDNLGQSSKQKSSSTRSAESTTSVAKSRTSSKKHDSPEITPDTVTNDAETAKVTSANVSDTLERIIVHKSSNTKSAKSTTSVAEASAPNEHQDSPEVKLDTVTNDAKTAKDTFANVPDSLKRFFKQKSSKTKSAKSTTALAEASAPNEYQGSSYVTSENYGETGKGTSPNMPENLGQTSKKKSSSTRSAESTISVAKSRTSSQKHDSPEVTPDTVTNDAKTAKVKSANVSDTLERIIVPKSSKIKSAKSTISVAEPSASNEYQESPEVKLDTVTNDAKTAKDTFANVPVSLKRFFKQKDSKTKSAKSTTSVAKSRTSNQKHESPEVNLNRVTNNAETAKVTSAKVSDTLKRIFIQKSNKTKSAKSTTSVAEASALNKHQHIFNVSSENCAETTNYTSETVRENLEQTSKQKISSTKFAKSTTSVAKSKTSNQKQDSPEVTPDKVTNDAETAKLTSVNVSDTWKQIFIQKTSKTKSAKSATYADETSASNEYQDSPEVKLDTVTNDAETAKDTSADVLDILQQIFKHKSSLIKSSKSTVKVKTAVEAGARNEHQDSSNVNSENYAETAKDTSPNMPDNLGQTSKQKSSSSKSAKSTTSVVKSRSSIQKKDSSEDTVTNDAETAKVTSANVSESLRRLFKQKGSKTKSAISTISVAGAIAVNEHQDSPNLIPNRVTNDADTAKDRHVNIEDSLKQPPKQKNSKTKSVISATYIVKANVLNEYQYSPYVMPDIVTKVAESAKDTSENMSESIKHFFKIRSAKSTTSLAKARTSYQHQDSPEIKLDTVTNGPETAKDTFTNVKDSLKQMCKQQTKSSITTTSVAKASELNEDQDDPEIKPDTVTSNTDVKKYTSTNIPDNLKQTCEQKSRSTRSAKSNTSVANARTSFQYQGSPEETVIGTYVNVEDSLKQTCKPENSKTKSAISTTYLFKASALNEHQDSPYVTPAIVTKGAESVKNTSVNVLGSLKHFFKEKSSKSKSAESATSEAKASVPNEHQYSPNQIQDVVTNDAEIAKDTIANVTDRLKQTEEQKNSEIKSDISSTSVAKATVLNEDQDGPEITPDTVTIDSDVEKDTSTNAPDILKQTYEQKNSNTKSVKSTTHVAKASAQNEHQGISNQIPDTVTNNADIVKGTNKHGLKQTSEQKNSKTKSAISTTSVAKARSLSKYQDNLYITLDTVRNDADIEKNTSTNFPANLKQSLDGMSSKNKSPENTISEFVVGPIDSPSVSPDMVIRNSDRINDMSVNVKQFFKKRSSRTTSSDADVTKDAPENDSDNTIQTFKKKSNKLKSTKTTKSKEVDTIANDNQNNIERELDTIIKIADTAKDTDNSKKSFEKHNKTTKSSENITPKVVGATISQKQDSLEVTPNTVTSKLGIAKNMPIIVSDYNMKHISKQKDVITKYDENAFPNAEAHIANTSKNLEIATKDDSVKENFHGYVHQEEISLKALSENVMECGKMTCKHSTKRNNNLAISTPYFDSNMECPCVNKHQEDLKVTPNTVKHMKLNNSNESDWKMQHSIGVRSDLGDGKKQISADKNINTKPAEKKIHDVVGGKLNKHLDNPDVEFDTATNRTNDTPVAVSNGSKLSTEQKHSMRKYDGKTTSGKVVRKPSEPEIPISKQNNITNESAENTKSEIVTKTQNKNQESLEVKPNTDTRYADVAKDTPSKISDTIKRISKQKDSKIKSTEHTISKTMAATPLDKHQNNFKQTCDMSTNKAETEELLFSNAPDNLRQTSLQKTTADNSTNEKRNERDTPAPVSDIIKRTPKQKSTMPKYDEVNRPNAAAGITGTSQDQDITLRKFGNSAKRGSHLCVIESDCDKNTCEHFGNRIYDPGKPASICESNIKCPCVYKSKKEGIRKTARNSNIMTQIEPGCKITDSLENASTITLHKQPSEENVNEDNKKTISISTKKSILKNTLRTYKAVENTLIDKNKATSYIGDKNDYITKNEHQNNSDVVQNTEHIISKSGRRTKVAPGFEEEPISKNRDNNVKNIAKLTSKTLESNKEQISDKSPIGFTSGNLGKSASAPCEYVGRKMSDDIGLTFDEKSDASKHFSRNILQNSKHLIKKSSCAECCKFQDRLKESTEIIGTVAKQTSSKNEGSVRFVFDNLEEDENSDHVKNANTFEDDEKFTPGDSSGGSKYISTDIYGKAENHAKFKCKKVNSAGFVFDSKVQRDDITCEDASRQIRNITETVPICTTSSKNSRTDVSIKNEGSTGAISDSVSVALLSLKLSSKNIGSLISCKIKPRNVSNIVKKTLSRFNLRDKNSVKSSPDSALIRSHSMKSNQNDTKNETNGSKSTPLPSCNKICEASTELGVMEYSTKKSIDDGAIKSKSDDSPIAPIGKTPTTVDNFSETTPPLTISTGTDANVKEKAMNSLKYCSRYCPTARKRNKNQQMTRTDNRSKTTHGTKIASTESKSNIVDNKIQNTITTTPDVTGYNAAIATASVVDSASRKQLNSNENADEDIRDVRNESKTETLLLDKKSNLYYCLQPTIKIYKEGEVEKKRVEFKCTDVKNENMAMKNSLNSERGSVYYRCRRKSKAEVNSATTMEDTEQIFSIKRQSR